MGSETPKNPMQWTREEHIADIASESPDTPRTAEIMGTYYWRECHHAEDEDRDVIQPMRELEREAARLRKEREEFERDARRYRWLRELGSFTVGWDDGEPGDRIVWQITGGINDQEHAPVAYGDTLDAACDAALSGETR